MKKILLVLAMVAASAFMAQPAIAADDVPPTQDTGQTATDPPLIPPVVVPPVVVDPPVVPPVVDPPAVDPPAVDPPATDPPATDPPATDPPAGDPPAADPPATEPLTTDSGARTAKTFKPPEICQVFKGLNNSECEPNCETSSPYTKGSYCPPPCDEKWSPSGKFKGDDCPPQCDEKWSPSGKFKGDDCHPRCDDTWSPSGKFKGDDCHPRCDDKWSPSGKFKGDDCHPRCDDKWSPNKSKYGHCEPKCHDHKRGKDYSHSDNKGDRSSFYGKDKGSHEKYGKHCPRPPKCETHDKKHHDKWWGEHSDDKPDLRSMTYDFPGGDWSHSGKNGSWDMGHKHHKNHCPTPKHDSDPSDPGTSASGVLPDTGGAPLWVLLMGGLLSAAGVTMLVRGAPVRASDSAGGGR